MRFIEEVCPMIFIRKCYRKIRELLTWGYPIAILRAKEEGRSIHEIHAGSMERIETYLEKGDDLAVSDEWKQVLEADVKAYVPKCFPQASWDGRIISAHCMPGFDSNKS